MTEDRSSFRPHRAPPPMADINVTPMVDVMLVLLIIFMVITPMLSKGVSVDFAKTRNPIPMPDAEKSDAIVIAVTRDGKTYLNTTMMPPEDLPPKVKDLLTNRIDKIVFLKADRRALYGRVVDVVDNLRAAGVDQLGLWTEQVQDKAKPATAAPTSARAGQ